MKEQLYNQACKFLEEYHWTDDSLKKAENPLVLVATMIQVFVSNNNLQPIEQPQLEQTDLHPVFDKDYLNECIAKSRLNQPDINTPFFGNSGAKIPIEQPDSLTIDEVKPELQEAFKILESEFSKTACQSLSYPQMIHVLCAMDEHAAQTERESCKKCAMANWPTKEKQIRDQVQINKKDIIKHFGDWWNKQGNGTIYGYDINEYLKQK